MTISRISGGCLQGLTLRKLYSCKNNCILDGGIGQDTWSDWKNSLNILQRDHDKTFSLNAGYPMATMAGALRVRLEKIGDYTLGDNQEPVTIEKCKKAISIMNLTTLLFCIVVSVPIMSILYLAGWWRLVLGIP